MQLERSRNAIRNVFFGYVNKTIGAIAPFIIKAILIRKFGSEYLGLNGLFTSVLQVLNLTELGIGTAIVWCMYEPIAKNDYKELSAILNLFRKIYRVIGITILAVGMLCLPVLDRLINGEAPADINVHFLFFLYLINTVESYVLFGYKTTLLTAYQRTDIISRIGTVVYLTQCFLQIIILMLSNNYYLFFGVSLVFTAVNNIVVSIVSKKMYPQIKCEGRVSSKTLAALKKKMYGLVIGKMCDVTRTSFDSIFSTALLGLTMTAIYNNYSTVISGVLTYFMIILAALSSGVGNSIVIESVEKNYLDMIRMDYIYSKLFGWACVYLVALYQPFMELWMGKDMVASAPTMAAFVVYFYSTLSTSMESIYLSGLGLWWETRLFSIAEMIANILLNYGLGKRFGLIGIVCGTVISFWCISIPGSLYIVRKYYFKNGIGDYINGVVQNIILTAGVSLFIYYLVGLVQVESLYITLLVRFLICTVIPPFLFWLTMRRTYRYNDARTWIKPRIRGMLK